MKTIFQNSLSRQAPALVLGLLFSLNITPAFAAATGQGDIVSNDCMQDVAGFDLGCTANDVRVSGVADTRTNLGNSCTDGADGLVDECDIIFNPVCDRTALNWNGGTTDCSVNPTVCLDGDGLSDPSLCGDKCAFPGDTTTFSTTFIFELSAQERYDVGAYFEVAPDLINPDDGALTGSCDIVTLPEDESLFTRPDGTTGNFVDLDTGCKGGGCPQPEDLCGDINDDNNPIYYDMRGAKLVPDQITVTCVDTDGDGLLNLPNCTSWRQKGANDVCLDGNDAFPGAPSKCNCDPNFQVPIDVPPATITVVKTADPTEVDEPGGSVQFDVSVTNDSLFAAVTIDDGLNPEFPLRPGLWDDIYGDITLDSTHGGDARISSTTCADGMEPDDRVLPLTLAPGETYSCYFEAQVEGQGNTSQTDTVTATAEDENENLIDDDDDATVDIIDVGPAMSVTKDCEPCSRVEPGGDFTFTVVVINDSTADDLTLTSLSDDQYGDLNGVGDCDVPAASPYRIIPQGGSYTCTFTVNELHQPYWDQTDVVEAIASDEEGNTLTRTARALIEITDVGSTMSAEKTAVPDQVYEPGDYVTYTFVVTNTSTVDTLSLDYLWDTIYGNLDNWVDTEGNVGNCDVSLPVRLVPGADYECFITVLVEGNAEDVISNEVTARAWDDDAEPNRLEAKAVADVTVIDVPPTATLTKDPCQMDVTYVVTVTNDSTAEALTLESLLDDKFGDVTQVQGKVQSTECVLGENGVEIAIGGQYQCTFVGRVTTSPHTNVLTGTVDDNDDVSPPVTPKDSATVTATPMVTCPAE